MLPNQLSAVQASALLRERKLSSRELTQACLQRINEREPQVHAWEYLDPERALAKAEQCDAGGITGFLYGLPIGLKDIIDSDDMPSLWGDEKTYAGRRPRRNAPVVQRLRDEGAFVLGKTAVSRFAFWWPGKTRNPNNLQHSPGSSSSGSAAAVADFMCPLAIGTQTGGSIIRPAVYCGVVGMKPSHDLIPWRNTRDFAPTFDVVGGFARSVADMSFMMRGLTGRRAFVLERGTSDKATIHVGLCRTQDWHKAPSYTKDNFEAAASLLSRHGIEVKDAVLPAIYDRLSDDQEIIIAYETARSFEWELKHADGLEPGLRELLEKDGLRYSREEYIEAMDRGERCRHTFSEGIAGLDLLMVPGTITEAPDASITGQNEFIRMWMMLHTPVVAMPFGKGPKGLPLGLQFVGRRGDDAALLQKLSVIEQVFASG
jgi:Asp-tRNA(Asn)/Glu-tRNA(Gln) amidotransferase A subunit family amidase